MSIPDPALAHYGVKGMKWGVRKGGVRSRFRGAAYDRNQRRTSVVRRVAEGRASRDEKLALLATSSLGKVALSGGLKKYASKTLPQLEAKGERIASGKATVREKLEMIMTTNAAELVISSRDNRG